MTQDMMTALLSLAGSLAGTYSGMKLITYRLDQLEKKVDKLSTLSERITAVENRIKQ